MLSIPLCDKGSDPVGPGPLLFPSPPLNIPGQVFKGRGVVSEKKGMGVWQTGPPGGVRSGAWHMNVTRKLRHHVGGVVKR